MNGRRSHGFVLVMVLVMLVVLSLLAGTVALVTQRLRDQALAREQVVQDDIDMASTRATVLYLLASQPMTIGGLTVDAQAAAMIREMGAISGEGGSYVLPVGNEVTLDNSAYRGVGGVLFSLQDDRGLFGVNMQPPQAVQRMLAQWDGGRAQPVQVLINRLEDYQDEDHLLRVGGMEREDYLAAGMRPPSNLPLSTPLELLRVAGWDEALGHPSSISLLDAITNEYSLIVNVNTAPPRVLRMLEGMDADMAERVLARRKLQPFLTEIDFFRFLGLNDQMQSAVGVYPSTSGTLRMWSARGGRVRAMHWTMTPTEDGGRPWREDYELIHSEDRPVDDVALAVASRLFAQPLPAQD